MNKVSGEDSEGFTTVSYKQKPTSGTPSVNTEIHQRQPLIGMRNSVSLPIVSKRERSKALFVSTFSPEVKAADVEKSLKERLSLKRIVCTRLKTKFNAYASFHISVNEEDFPFINKTDVWPNGSLIAPFYEKLTSDKVYSSSAPLTSVPAVAPSDFTKSPTTKLTALERSLEKHQYLLTVMSGNCCATISDRLTISDYKRSDSIDIFYQNVRGLRPNVPIFTIMSKLMIPKLYVLPRRGLMIRSVIATCFLMTILFSVQTQYIPISV
jgi:hypothetical protein